MITTEQAVNVSVNVAGQFTRVLREDPNMSYPEIFGIAYIAAKEQETPQLGFIRGRWAVLDFLRARGRIQRAGALKASLHPTASETTETTLMARIDLSDALMILDDDEFRVFQERIVMKTSQKDLAAKLGTTRKLVRTAEERVLTKLRKALADWR